VDFLASIELTGYVDLTDFHKIWPKDSLVVSRSKVCEPLFDISNSPAFTPSYVTTIGKYCIR